MKSNFKDNTIFENPETNERVLFNTLTFYEILKGCVMEYAHKSESEATQLMDIYLANKYPPKSYEDAIFFTHEHEYHWAMIIAFGEGYWQNSSISSVIPKDYADWEKRFIEEKKLSAYSYDFFDD